MTVWLTLVAAAAAQDDVDRWLLESKLVVRGEVSSIQFETPGSPDTRTHYQISIVELIRGRVDSALLTFTAPGGGSIGSTTDFTLAFREEIVLFVPEARDDGSVEYDWSKGHALARFEGEHRASLVAVVEPGNSRRPLGPSCLLGDLETTAPVPVSARTAGLDSGQRSVRRMLELPLLDGCGWEIFLDILRERAVFAQADAQSIAGAAPLLPDPALVGRNWYEFREELRSKYGSTAAHQGNR